MHPTARLAFLPVLAALFAGSPARARAAGTGPAPTREPATPAPARGSRSASPGDGRVGAEPAREPQLTRAPQLVRFVEAQYPEAALAARRTGAVGLQVDLDEHGAVTAVEVTDSAGEGFDEAAVAAVRQFVFSPAEIDGQPAPVRIGYRYHFTLKPEAPAPESAKASVVNFRGVVRQRGNRAPVPASVSIDEGALGAEADASGAFSFSDVPAGRHRVVVSAPGFERFETEEEVVAGSATQVVYYLRARIFSPYESVVRARRERKEVARVELEQEEIRLVPGTQGDAFKVVQNLPGVARAPYGFGMLVVRGSRPTDTRVYIDGIYVPTIFHFGGLTSVYNSDLLAGMTFHAGNFGARYGRAIAGTVEAETRTPSRQGVHGYLNVNLIDTSALLEAPLDERWSLAAAGRVSYVDLVLQEFLPSSVQFMSAPRYYDYQVRADREGAGGERLRLTAFGSNDSLKLLLTNPALLDPEGRSDIGGEIGFHRVGVVWSKPLSPTVRNQLTAALGVDQVRSSVGSDIRIEGRLSVAQLRDSLLLELGPRLSLEVGTDTYLGDAYSDATSPPMPLPGEFPDPFASRQLRHDVLDRLLFEPSLFAEAVFKPIPSLRLVPGVRLDYEHTLGFVTLDPRLSAFQQLGEKTLVKAGVGLYQQPPDLRAGQWSPQFGNPDLGAERGIHTMLGAERRLTDALSVDLQLYYKHLTSLVTQSARTISRDGQAVLERYANEARGRAYGAELLLRHELTRNFFGWIAYSLSRSERYNPLATRPEWRLHRFDQPHHLVVVGSYKWPRDWVTGLRLQVASGNLVTPLSGTVYDADGDVFMPLPGRVTERMPTFVSLDLRVDKRFVFEQWLMSVYLDVQNVTNNVNAEYLLYNYDYSQRDYLRGLPILPTLGVKAEF